MTERNPPVSLQAGGDNGEDLRRLIQSLTGGRAGPFLAGDLAVTQTGTPSMAVSVADGRALVDGSSNTYQGSYFVDNRGPKTVTIAAASTTNPRWDLIVARVRDVAYIGGATNAWALEAVTGTASASPTDPAVPADTIVLARVVVAANATSIVNANITDLRTSPTLGQSLVIQPSSTISTGIPVAIAGTFAGAGATINSLTLPALPYPTNVQASFASLFGGGVSSTNQMEIRLKIAGTLRNKARISTNDQTGGSSDAFLVAANTPVVVEVVASRYSGTGGSIASYADSTINTLVCVRSPA